MNEIKLIIWDLDDTLWQGTLAEGDNVVLKEDVIQRIQFLLNRGIVHSICSKNNAERAKEILRKFELYDLFIFPKVSFEDKGLQIKKIITQAQLREQNVLFVDDNPFVLREVSYHNPSITTQLIDDFMQEDVTNWGKNDSKRERLAQYKILEKKEEHKTVFLEKTNDEQAFLKECDIKIQLTPLDIKDKQLERIIELVNRSNQMNFTQSRLQYEYLFILFELKNGINFKVEVKDKYGDYGIVGYICILNNKLLHFVFSCRILGMKIEARTYQWIKAQYPDIKIPFDVAKLKSANSNLDFIEIAYQKESQPQQSNQSNQKILVRGPCLANAVSFLLSEHYQVDEEIFSFFEYANLNFLRANINQTKEIWFDKTLKALKNNDYKMIVNFLESDYYSGNYKFRNQLIPISSHYIFWENLRNLKQKNEALSSHVETMIIDAMRDIKKYNISHRFSPWPRIEKITNKTIDWFGVGWRKLIYQLMLHFVFKNYQGYVSENQFEQNILWYVGLFPKDVQLVFINPPEKITLPLVNPAQSKKIIKRTKALNNIIRKIAKENQNIILLEMDDILEQEDIIDSFSHLKRQGYIKLSQSLLNVAKGKVLSKTIPKSYCITTD